MRLIDADQFLADESEAYMSAQIQIHKTELLYLNSLVHKKIQLLIKDAPTVDVTDTNVGRKGKWIENEDDYYSVYTIECSNCHHEWCFEVGEDVKELDYNFCPNCGADMRGEE